MLLLLFCQKAMLFDKIVGRLREKFMEVRDNRRKNLSYPLVDMLSIGFAMFSLKDSSLSCFRDNYSVRSENLKQIYGIETLCGDTALREGLDVVNSKELQPLFAIPIAELRLSGELKEREVLGGYTAVSVDGTGHYCSCKKQCPQCMVKKHRNGKFTYYHQLLGAVMVHPKQKTVFPVACEAIVKQDGSTKNDCELNACKRLIPQIRKILPDQKIIAIFDALYANGPHVQSLKAANINYIIGTKGQTVVDMQVRAKKEKGEIQQIVWQKKGVKHTIFFTNDLMLNTVYPDTKTNYFEYSQVDIQTGESLFYSTWMTDIEVTVENVKELVQVARARWKIENETFNTLKNQGYHLEHNYGHGKKNLATNFAILTFLAFLVDQVTEHLDQNFQRAKKACKTLKNLWYRIRTVFDLAIASSMDAIYRFIITKKPLDMPPLE